MDINDQIPGYSNSRFRPYQTPPHVAKHLELCDRVFDQSFRLMKQTGVGFYDALVRTAAGIDAADEDVVNQCRVMGILDPRIETPDECPTRQDGADWLAKDLKRQPLAFEDQQRPSPWVMPEHDAITPSGLRKPVAELPDAAELLELLF